MSTCYYFTPPPARLMFLLFWLVLAVAASIATIVPLCFPTMKLCDVADAHVHESQIEELSTPEIPLRNALEAKLQDLVREGRVSSFEAAATRIRWLNPPTPGGVFGGNTFQCGKLLPSNSRMLSFVGFAIVVASYFTFCFCNDRDVSMSPHVTDRPLLTGDIHEVTKRNATSMLWLPRTSQFCVDDAHVLLDLLSALCDCVVHLGPNLELLSPSPAMAKLVMQREINAGEDFKQFFYSEDDVDVFLDVAMSGVACGPRLINTRFRDSKGDVFGAEIWHAHLRDVSGRHGHVACIRREGLGIEGAASEVEAEEEKRLSHDGETEFEKEYYGTGTESKVGSEEELEEDGTEDDEEEGARDEQGRRQWNEKKFSQEVATAKEWRPPKIDQLSFPDRFLGEHAEGALASSEFADWLCNADDRVGFQDWLRAQGSGFFLQGHDTDSQRGTSAKPRLANTLRTARTYGPVVVRHHCNAATCGTQCGPICRWNGHVASTGSTSVSARFMLEVRFVKSGESITVRAHML